MLVIFFILHILKETVTLKFLRIADFFLSSGPSTLASLQDKVLNRDYKPLPSDSCGCGDSITRHIGDETLFHRVSSATVASERRFSSSPLISLLQTELSFSQGGDEKKDSKGEERRGAVQNNVVEKKEKIEEHDLDSGAIRPVLAQTIIGKGQGQRV